jgi:hypothetical protein
VALRLPSVDARRAARPHERSRAGQRGGTGATPWSRSACADRRRLTGTLTSTPRLVWRTSALWAGWPSTNHSAETPTKVLAAVDDRGRRGPRRCFDRAGVVCGQRPAVRAVRSRAHPHRPHGAPWQPTGVSDGGGPRSASYLPRIRFTAPMGTTILERLRRPRVWVTAALCVAAVAAGIGVALATEGPIGAARYHQARLGAGNDPYPYLVYVPASYRRASVCARQLSSRVRGASGGCTAWVPNHRDPAGRTHIRRDVLRRPLRRPAWSERRGGVCGRLSPVESARLGRNVRSATEVSRLAPCC